MFVDRLGNLYDGDLQPGDRVATQSEIDHRNALIADMAKPRSVTRRQFKLALNAIGLYDIVDQEIQQSGDRELQINWREAMDFQRDNPLVLGMAERMNKTPSDIDDLFVAASSM